MFRTRLVGAALLCLGLLPGCRLCCPDRPCLFDRCRGGGAPVATPMAYPAMDGGCGMPVPTGGPIYGGPINGGPIYPGIGGALNETLPPPIAGDGVPPRIPKAGIKESPPGKQFELEGASKTGPVLTIPAAGSKGN